MVSYTFVTPSSASIEVRLVVLPRHFYFQTPTFSSFQNENLKRGQLELEISGTESNKHTAVFGNRDG